MNVYRSLLLSQPFGGFILPELSFFDAMKSFLLSLTGHTFPPHPLLTQQPLSLMPTLVFWSGGLDLLSCIGLRSHRCGAMCNNWDLNVTLRSHFNLNQVIEMNVCREGVLERRACRCWNISCVIVSVRRPTYMCKFIFFHFHLMTLSATGRWNTAEVRTAPPDKNHLSLVSYNCVWADSTKYCVVVGIIQYTTEATIQTTQMFLTVSTGCFFGVTLSKAQSAYRVSSSKSLSLSDPSIPH